MLLTQVRLTVIRAGFRDPFALVSNVEYILYKIYTAIRRKWRYLLF